MISAIVRIDADLIQVSRRIMPATLIYRMVILNPRYTFNYAKTDRGRQLDNRGAAAPPAPQLKTESAQSHKHSLTISCD
jgi:hypothetical protein